ncbi:MAG: AAA family ATPase, partial [Actinomycetota bacterium]
RAELEQWGGTVEKFIGDAVVAVFGAPIAREDDPERALRAALAIRDWATDENGVEVRIAVNTGEALVSLDAHPDSGEGFIAGDVVNTASRLQSAAPVNGILVGEQTQRATTHVIDYRAAEPVVAKGKSEPIAVWEALQARSRFGVDVRQHGGAALVGRASELNALLEALGRAQQEREPQLVTLVGVPGIGKSRLAWELFGAVGRGDTLVYWRQGRSLPLGEGVSFWALSEMVKAQAGILEGDDAEVVAEKLGRAVHDVVEEDAGWVAERLGPLVGVEAESAVANRDESFAAWRTFLESLADRRPLVLVFEDVHWADEGLLDFIDHLVDWATGVPMLVLCTARPELLERRPGWGGGKRNAMTLNVSPLSEQDASKLLSLVLERAVLPAETQQALLERASGNPLSAEQFARLYLERGTIDDLALPESVHGLIAARLDALPVDEKALLQDAAVIGKVFWSVALGGGDGAAERLHSLERKEFIRRERRSSVAGEGEFAFRHVLVRDVAYGQIPRADRAAKHLRAAEWLEDLGRPQDHAELVAHHYLAALELERAAKHDTTAIAARAVEALRDAGDRAAALNAFRAAADYYRAALEGLPDEGRERADTLLRLGRAEFYGEGAGSESLSEAALRLETFGEVEAAAEAENLIAMSGFLSGDRERTDTHLARATRLVAALPASLAKASVVTTRARSAYLSAEYASAHELAQEALAMAEALGLEAIRAEALLYSGSSRLELGDPAGLDDVRESIAIGNAINSTEVARSYNNLSVLLRLEGRLAEARDVSDEGHRVAERFGLVPYLNWDRAAEPGRLFELGRWSEALRAADATLENRETGTFHRSSGWPSLVRAQIRVARDDDAGALDDTGTALERARIERYPQAIYPALAVHAFVLTSVGRFDDGRETLDEMLALRALHAEPLAFGGSSIAPWVYQQHGLLEEFLDLIRGRRTPWLDAAESAVVDDWTRAAEIYARCGAVNDEAFARLQSGGDANLRAALDFYRSVEASRYVRQAEAGLAATG